MKREALEELAMNHISDLVDQLVVHQSNNDHINMAIVHAEIKELTRALDSDDASDNFFYAPDMTTL
jgi:hypothetical protein